MRSTMEPQEELKLVGLSAVVEAATVDTINLCSACMKSWGIGCTVYVFGACALNACMNVCLFVGLD